MILARKDVVVRECKQNSSVTQIKKQKLKNACSICFLAMIVDESELNEHSL
jgi:hypothetical protein